MQCESKKHKDEAAFDLHVDYQAWVGTGFLSNLAGQSWDGIIFT